jgi:prepilin peptidase CpaA
MSFVLGATTIVIGSFVHDRQWFAGGDVKLIAAGAAVFGSSGTIDFLLLTALAGGLLAAATALKQRRLVTVLGQVGSRFTPSGAGLQPSTEYGALPYGIAIASGAFLVTIAGYFTGLRLPL